MIDIFFSQTGAVLFSEAPTREQLEGCFSGGKLTPLKDPETDDAGKFQGPGFSLVWNETTGETAEIDIQNVPWPDDLGEGPPANVTLAAAGVGAFGAGTAPGGLERAVKQAWHWKEAAEVTGRHRAFVRIRLHGTMLQEGEKSPPAEQLGWVLDAAARIAALPGALAWFCPAGELVMSPGQLGEEIAEAAANRRPPVNALCATRLWHRDGWAFVETAGMHQFRLPDFEFAGLASSTDPTKTVIAFKNLSIYLIENGDVIQTGNTADGPAAPWRAQRCGRGVKPPLRSVIRWAYDNTPPLPPELEPQEPEAPPPRDPDDFLHKMIEFAAEEVHAWQHELPLYRANLSRFQQTVDYVTLGALATEVRDERQLAAVMSTAVLIPTFPAIGNADPSLRVRPSLVVGTFDTRVEAIVQCALLADRMGDLYGDGPAANPAERAIQEIVKDDKYVPGKRTRVPEPAAGGFEIYVFNVLLTAEKGSEEESAEASIKPVLTSPGEGSAPAIGISLGVLRGKPEPSIYSRITGEPAPRQGAGSATASPPAKKSNTGKIILLIVLVLALLGVLNNIINGGDDPRRRRRDKHEQEQFEETLEQRRRPAPQPKQTPPP